MFQLTNLFGSSLLTAICTGLEAAATALGLTSEELSAEFQRGKTLSRLAIEKGIDPVAVQQAVQAATSAGPKAAIQQAVIDGQLTQDNADWLLLGLEKNYWGAGNLFGPGFALGRGSMSRLSSQAMSNDAIGVGQFS